MNTRVLSFLAAALAFSATACAQSVISHFRSLSPISVNTTWNQSVSLPGFDSGLGVLTQVNLTFSGNISQTLAAENLDPGSRSYHMINSVTLALSNPNGPLLALPPSVLQQNGTLAAFDGNFDSGGTSGATFVQTTPLSAMVLDGNLSNYIDAALVSFSVGANGTSILSGAGTIFMQGSASAGATLNVEYMYSPIPEPDFFAALLGIGALGLLARHARRPTVAAIF